MNRKTIELEVGGMSCRRCHETVREALQKVPGVITVSVDLGTRWVIVTAEDWVRDEDLVAAVEEIDYPARIREVAMV